MRRGNKREKKSEGLVRQRDLYGVRWLERDAEKRGYKKKVIVRKKKEKEKKRKDSEQSFSSILGQIFARYNPSYIRRKMISCRRNDHSVVFYNGCDAKARFSSSSLALLRKHDERSSLFILIFRSSSISKNFMRKDRRHGHVSLNPLFLDING